MTESGLDAEKLRALEIWGAGLQSDTRAEVAAAGRAILMLIQEIERLHVLIWDKKLFPQADLDAASGGPTREDVGTILRRRLSRRPQAPSPDG